MSRGRVPGRRRGRAVLLGFLALLAASHVVRTATPPPPPRATTTGVTEVAYASAPDGVSTRAHVAWWRAGPVNGADAAAGSANGAANGADGPLAPRPDGESLARGADARPTVVLLHGSPGRKEHLIEVGRRLASRYDVLAPDLPGFGDSSRAVPDLSIRSHAAAVGALLDALAIDRVHLVGFSMGGGVALHLWDEAPSRVASVTLLSAIGVQELELLGDYTLNHLLHGLQLAGLWAAHECLPHFGAFDGAMLDVAYARNFYDTDQRPLRAILGRLDAPTLIYHGDHDVLVSPAAAREHHRLVPQSELAMVDANHFVVFRQPELVAARLAAFLDAVDRGAAPTRADASPARASHAAAPFDPSSVPPIRGLPLVVLLALLALSTLVSEDLACIGAGLLVAQDRIGFVEASAACLVGIVVGDLALFAAGRWLGRGALARAPLRWWLPPERVDAASAWFRERGLAVILGSRFVPGTRLPTYFAAGLLHTSVWWFAGYFFAASLVWTPLLVGFATLAGASAVELWDDWGVLGLLLVALVLLGIVKLVVPLGTRRGRRLHVGRWRRWRRWEFWPPWLFYAPVVVRVLGAALRDRPVTTLTAINPSIPTGGFAGESKAAILERLARTPLGEGLVARTRLLPAGLCADERLARLEAFLSEHDLTFPVVIKPDVGERGAGVTIARNLDEAAARLTLDDEATILQEYVDGPEFGLFWTRRPGEPGGELFSITEKVLPEVVGDGRRTIEHLILDDDRAVCAARAYFARLGEQLARVPAAGEAVRLTDLGTHCRGAIFLDGEHVRTPALERTVDALSRGLDGFDFGRYDVRASSLDALREGRGFRVLELNGVTSEATHVYDPRHRLRDAYRVLFEQWRRAFALARERRDAGGAVTPLGTLVQVTATSIWRRVRRG